jgi:cytochrome c553
MMNAKRIPAAWAVGRPCAMVARQLLTPVMVIAAAILDVALFATANAAPADNSKANWTVTCAACHGPKGKGNAPAGRMVGAPDYSDPKVQASFTDDHAFKDIKEGLQVDGRMKMKPFAEELTDLDIGELVQYIRSFKKGK